MPSGEAWDCDDTRPPAPPPTALAPAACFPARDDTQPSAGPCPSPAPPLPGPGAPTTAPRRLEPCQRLGLGKALIEARREGQRSVWSGVVESGLHFLWATSRSKAAQQQPNAGHQARREAGAQRTLYAVAVG
jgi:hypothetical protein